MTDIDWTAINAKLPTASTLIAREQRKQLFQSFDNGNGVLSLAEVDKAIRDILKIDAIFDAKPAILRAFQIAKNSSRSNREIGDEFLELKEFRYFLLSLRQYFEYWVAFSRMDRSGDRKISLAEFKKAKGVMEVWVGKIGDLEGEFKKIDKNGGGSILFDEFCTWAIQKNLDLEDDDDDIAK